MGALVQLAKDKSARRPVGRHRANVLIVAIRDD
jgi:hypothetical protein